MMLGGLDVAMDHATVVREGERVGDLLHDAHRFDDGEALPGGAHAEVRAVQQFHRHVDQVDLSADVVDGGEVAEL